VVQPLPGGCRPLDGLARIAGKLPGAILLGSCPADSLLARYSFLTADPVEWFTLDPSNAGSGNTGAATTGYVDRTLSKYSTPNIDGLPPFQGGWAGVCGYELGGLYERLPSAEFDPLQFPWMQLGLYDFVIAWDHATEKSWIISQGIPERSAPQRLIRARDRVGQIESLLAGDMPSTGTHPAPAAHVPGNGPPLVLLDEPAQLYGNFSRDGYLEAASRCVDYIHAGDAFQINLSQQLWTPATVSGVELATRLSRSNPAPFSAFMDLGNHQVISSSPERLFSVRNGRIESRPIKGTRSRFVEDPILDKNAADELLASVKDRAENTMIVDLIRNDLSRICTDDSVQVTQWCGLESFATVHHLVSSVCGRLREEAGPSQILEALFPGGSVTGAPRIRAMEIITELERTARGAYCGSMGYFGLNGNADFNILIRTVTARNGWWQIPVGGGIVARSVPEHEYEETWTKAAGILDAIGIRGGSVR